MYFSIKAHKFHILKNIIGNKKLNVLDVGCGNHSPSETIRNFNNITYHGLDLEINPNYFESDKLAIKKMFIANLDDLNLSEIENDFYDVIIMCHVIEHLHNGEKVISLLNSKLKKNGYFYIECPSPKSVNFPSMKGTLNFYDDDTHVKIYSIDTIINVLKNETVVISSGVVRSFFNLILIPYKILKSKISRGYIRAYILWDLYGFANYVLFQKK
jgi:SAM-dependent methyltransferase